MTNVDGNAHNMLSFRYARINGDPTYKLQVMFYSVHADDSTQSIDNGKIRINFFDPLTSESSGGYSLRAFQQLDTQLTLHTHKWVATGDQDVLIFAGRLEYNGASDSKDGVFMYFPQTEELSPTSIQTSRNEDYHRFNAMAAFFYSSSQKINIYLVKNMEEAYVMIMALQVSIETNSVG